MSFRSRLTVFFLLIVVLPIAVIAALVVSITDDSRTGKADARLAEALVTAHSIYADDLAASAPAARAIGTDGALSTALQAGSPAAIQAAASRAAARENVKALVLRDASGKVIASVGNRPVAASTAQLRTAGGGDAGTLNVSTTTPSAYLGSVHAATGLDAALTSQSERIDATLDVGTVEPPSPGEAKDVTVGDDKLRAASVALPGPGAVEVTLFGPVESKGFFSSRPLVVIALVVFFGVAFLFAAGILRALGAQIRTMLGAAKRIGDGDFTGEVPVLGDDELAGLASEFNKMRERLAVQMGQLRSQRDEIERSVQRIGQAFASGLDREALLEILVDTALTACNAEYGIVALGGRSGGEVERGEPNAELRDAVLASEEQASREGRMVEYSEDGMAALSSPLSISGEPARRGGVMSVARAGAPFDASESDLFAYLLGQISASIENIALHEMVSEQAVTDDLTGLSNKRRFRELLGKEAARAERFRHDLSLLMLDIDNFKQINDTYGHLQGDEVLRSIAAALDTESRGVDEPARYGGEEFAIALPETGIEGALEVGERIRTRIAAQQVERLDGDGSIGVTASIGVATMNGGPDDVEALIAAADAALYEAKGAGKDRVVAAE